MAKQRDSGYTELVYEVLRSAERPLAFQEIVDRVSARRPITTRNPKGTIRTALGAGRQLVSLGDGRYGYLPRLLPGSLLRLPLSDSAPADAPLLYPDDIREALWPSFFESQKRQDRRPVPARLPNGAQVLLPLQILGPGDWGGSLAGPLRQLLVDRRAEAGDALLIRVVEDPSVRCEIRLERRQERNEEAVAARNQELADATVRLFRERGPREVPIWDLIAALLARGAFKADVAPDPLVTVLQADPRFTDTGLASWILTEAMTPALRAEATMRQELERELISAGPGAAPAGGPFLSPLAMRSVLERALADAEALLAERQPETLEEANALLQELLATGGPPGRNAATPLEQAQDLMFDAWQAGTSRERVRLARKALDLSPDCADAYVLLAEETARTPREAADLYAKGVAAGERALGAETFEQDAGSFWSILETRPYMRARLGLAQALWAMDEIVPAVQHLRDLLRLNPGDNQGVRYLLLNWLLELDAADALDSLFNAYPDDMAAVWTYGRALHAFRREGDTPASRRLRADARRWNRHVPAYLSGKKRLPRQLPGLIGMSDESEAIACAAEQLAAWRSTPGAIAWLTSGSR